MIKLFLIITSAFFIACVPRAPQKAITKKKNRMTCFERLDTAEANRRILECSEKEEMEFPKEQFLSPFRYCQHIDSMGCTVSVTNNIRRQRKGNLFGRYGRCFYE